MREQAEARDEDPILAGVRRAVARGEEGLRDLGEALSRAAEAVIARGDEALLVHTLAHYSEIFAYASESFHVEPFLPVHEHDPAMLMRALERAMGPADRRRFMDDLYIVSETAECGNDPLPECVAAFAEKWRERHP